MKLLITSMVFGMFSLAFAAEPVVTATFTYSPAMRGTCVDKSSVAENILSQHGIKISALPAAQKQILEEVVQHMATHAGDRFDAVTGVKVRYIKDLQKVYARQTQGPIDVGPRSLGNYAVFTHELGHVVGNRTNSAGQRYYDLYNRAVKNSCHFSKYSKVSHGYGKRNEEFAEVFAAYLLVPELLLSFGPECRQAYDFFRSTLFTGQTVSCSSH